MALTKTPIELSSTPSIVDGGNATAITIDSSENVMIGKASNAFATVGTAILGGEIQVTRAGVPMYLRRNSSDGDILVFNKDGTAVGSLGTGSNLLTIGTGTGRILFENALVAPCSTSSLGASDGVVALGASSRRFKDLYLSGGVFLGGTGSANKLTDYEEGTWTGSPTAGSSSVLTVTDEKYTKIGNQVTIACTINFSGASGVLNVAGLPFNCAPAGVGIAREDSVSGYLVYGRVLSGTTDIDLFSPGTGNASPFLTSAGGFRFTMTYLS